MHKAIGEMIQKKIAPNITGLIIRFNKCPKEYQILLKKVNLFGKYKVNSIVIIESKKNIMLVKTRDL